MIGSRGGRGYLLGARLNYAETEADKHVICSGTGTLYFTDISDMNFTDTLDFTGTLYFTDISYMNFTDTLYFTDELHIIIVPKMDSSGCASLGRVFKRALMCLLVQTKVHMVVSPSSA